MSRPEALPVYIRLANGDERETIGWACPECKTYYPVVGHRPTPESARQAAEDCCHRPCEGCGVDMGDSSGWTHCAACREKREQSRYRERVAKAKSVAWKDYHQQAVFCEELDALYTDLDELREELVQAWVCCKMSLDEPPVLWGCTPRPLRLDAEDLLYGELEDHYEGASDDLDPKVCARLQRMLDKVCCDLDITSYDVDYATRVDMPSSWWDECRADMAKWQEDASS
jgi:hypothetical protein